jgi:hypothetical protein
VPELYRGQGRLSNMGIHTGLNTGP